MRAADRDDAPEELRILRSPAIPEEGFVHGFPERWGGVSEGPRSTLNLGFRWGDERERVEENRRRVARRAGYDADALAVTKHVHGTRVWRVGERRPEPPEFDGLVADRPGAVLGAFAADCIPIVFADPDARVCGAAHAGWRGTVGGVARVVIARMEELGSRPSSIRAALGPSIGPCCFEVGDEVVAAFSSAFPALAEAGTLVVAGPRRAHVDLRAAMRAQLEDAGLAPNHIDADAPCTMCSPERFFSYRRDGKEGGVHMGFIGLV